MGLKITRIKMDKIVKEPDKTKQELGERAFSEATYASQACSVLVKEVPELGFGDSLLLWPLREGPLGALRTIQQLQEDRSFDRIVPTYIAEQSNTPRAKDWLQKEVGQEFDIQKCVPVAGTYDGGSGEMFAASSRALHGTGIKETFLSANVLLRVSSANELILTIDDFFVQYDAILGYAVDARDDSLYTSGVGFPRNIQVDVPAEMTEIAKVLNNLLEGEYGTSPLRSIEVIRSIMVYEIANASEGIDALNLWKSLDKIYDILAKKGQLRHLDRNEINRALRSQLVSADIISVRPLGGKRFIVQRSGAWDTYTPLLDVYQKFATASLR